MRMEIEVPLWQKLVVGMLVLLLVAGFSLSLWMNVESKKENDKLWTENAALKTEKIEWQKAAQRAVDARDWTLPLLRAGGLKPDDLERALEPCLTEKGGFVQTPECLHAAKYQSLSNIPITITWR